MKTPLRACLKTVVSAILADVEPGFQPGGNSVESMKGPIKSERFRNADDFSGRQDAALYGRPGGPPLLFEQALSTRNEPITVSRASGHSCCSSPVGLAA